MIIKMLSQLRRMDEHREINSVRKHKEEPYEDEENNWNKNTLEKINNRLEEIERYPMILEWKN